MKIKAQKKNIHGILVFSKSQAYLYLEYSDVSISKIYFSIKGFEDKWKNSIGKHDLPMDL